MAGIKIVSELYYPEQNATGYFLTGIAEALSAEETSVSVLCAQPSYNQRGDRAPKRERRNDVDIRRCWSTTFNPRKVWGRLVNFMTTSLSLGFSALYSIKRNDRVLVVTNPPLLPFFVRIACYLKGAKFVLLVHDVYPDVFVPLGIIKAESLFYRVMSRVNGKLYASSHAVVALGRDMARLVTTKSKGKAKVAIIPNWGDVDVIQPSSKAENVLLQELNLTDNFMVQYSGNHGRTHDLLSLIEAANLLKNESDIHFLLVGEGSGKSQALAHAERLGLSNISFRSFVDRAELNTSLNASDLSLIAFKPGMAGISVPSRFYNLMAAGKPILAVVDDDSEVAEVIREENIGRVVAPHNPLEIAETILKLRNDESLRCSMGQRARIMAEEKYSYSVVKTQYQALFKSL